MNFSLSDETKAMQQIVREFAQNEIAPIAAELDRNPEFPRSTLRKMGDLGLLGVLTDEEYGGANLGHVAYVTLLEEIAAADAGHAVIMSVTNGLPQRLLVEHGSDAQRAKYLPLLASGEWIGAFSLSEPGSGSDAANLLTKADRMPGGYVLNGTKAWVTSGGEAEVYFVMAKTDVRGGPRAITCFIVEKDQEGVSFGRPEEKLGQRCAVTTTMTFDDCFVPDENVLGPEGHGFVIAMSGLDGGRIGIGALAVGIGRAAFEAATEYALEREAFGQPIYHHQGVAFKLSDMDVELEAARLLVQRAAWLKDTGRRVTREAAHAKLFASETAGRITNDALQIFGGYGYTMDYPVERYFRDARVTEIYEGTSEIQRIVISRQIYRDKERD